MKKNKDNKEQLPLFEVVKQQKKIAATKKKSKIKNSKNSIDLDELKKTHHTHLQYKSTVANADKNIQQLLQLSLEKLGRNLDVIREQMEMAFKKKKYASYELLYEWEQQVSTARLLKLDSEEKCSKKDNR